jgi:hypothetical protein
MLRHNDAISVKESGKAVNINDNSLWFDLTGSRNHETFSVYKSVNSRSIGF